MIESLLCCLQLDLERIERGAGIYVIDGFEKIVQDRSTDRIEEAHPELKHLGVLISVLATHIQVTRRRRRRPWRFAALLII